MNPNHLAATQCSNYQKDGSCLGVSQSCFPSSEPQPPFPRCLLADGQRCQFFERSVLPLADRPSPKNEPGLQGRAAEAMNKYFELHDAGRPKQIGGRRNCPRCGGLLDRGKRYCDPCRQLQRNESQKKNMQKWRNQNA